MLLFDFSKIWIYYLIQRFRTTFEVLLCCYKFWILKDLAVMLLICCKTGNFHLGVIFAISWLYMLIKNFFPWLMTLIPEPHWYHEYYHSSPLPCEQSNKTFMRNFPRTKIDVFTVIHYVTPRAKFIMLPQEQQKGDINLLSIVHLLDWWRYRYISKNGYFSGEVLGVIRAAFLWSIITNVSVILALFGGIRYQLLNSLNIMFMVGPETL